MLEISIKHYTVLYIIKVVIRHDEMWTWIFGENNDVKVNQYDFVSDIQTPSQWQTLPDILGGEEGGGKF